MKLKRETRQHPGKNNAWKHRFQSSPERHRHLLASVKHHGTNLGRRAGLCLGLLAVRERLAGCSVGSGHQEPEMSKGIPVTNQGS